MSGYRFSQVEIMAQLLSTVSRTPEEQQEILRKIEEQRQLMEKSQKVNEEERRRNFQKNVQVHKQQRHQDNQRQNYNPHVNGGGRPRR